MQSGDKVPCAESMSKSEKYHFSKYGKLPCRGLLGKRSHERTYFDSGDFALSATDHMSDDGAVQTGTEHPHRDSISHPYAPIPAASNVDMDANEDVNRKSIVPESSPLLQQTNYKNEELGAA